MSQLSSKMKKMMENKLDGKEMVEYIELCKGEFTGFQKIQFHEKLKENGKEVIRYNCCKEQPPAETEQVYHQHCRNTSQEVQQT